MTNGPCCAQYLHRGCPPVPQGPLSFRNIHLGVCHKELLCHKTTQKSRGAQALLGRALGGLSQKEHPQECEKAMVGG